MVPRFAPVFTPAGQIPHPLLDSDHMHKSRQNSEDRRTSLRIHARLPLQWRLQTGMVALPDLAAHWGLGQYLECQQALASLDQKFDRALHDIKDPATVSALRLLNSKMDLVAQGSGTSSEAAEAPPIAVELSADGLGFELEQPLTQSSTIGVHLILPGPFHLLCNAQVSRCDRLDRSSRYHVGLTLLDLPPSASRRLTRFVISHHETS